MFSYIIRRLLLLPPTLIGITLVVFFVIASAPGGIGGSILSAEGAMRPAERKARMEYLNKRYGLDRPKIVQYLSWLNRVSPIGSKDTGEGFPQTWRIGFKTPDLGHSFVRGRRVGELLVEALPVSIALQVISIPVTYLLAVITGIYAARYRGKIIDVGSGTTMIGLYSIPTIWTGVLFIGFLCNRDYVWWFPTNGLHDLRADSMSFLPTFAGGFHRGWLLDAAWHLIGPVVCISYGNIAVLSKLTRASLLDTLSLDYVRTAQAKGLPERIVLFRHAFRNSLIPLITAAASILPALVSGALIVETIFGLPGMGRLAYEAIESRDTELLLSDTLLVSLLTLIGYLLADIGYAVADPRVSYDDR